MINPLKPAFVRLHRSQPCSATRDSSRPELRYYSSPPAPTDRKTRSGALFQTCRSSPREAMRSLGPTRFSSIPSSTTGILPKLSFSGTLNFLSTSKVISASVG